MRKTRSTAGKKNVIYSIIGMMSSLLIFAEIEDVHLFFSQN